MGHDSVVQAYLSPARPFLMDSSRSSALPLGVALEDAGCARAASNSPTYSILARCGFQLVEFLPWRYYRQLVHAVDAPSLEQRGILLVELPDFLPALR